MGKYVNQDRYPTEFDLHKKYAQSELLLDLVWTHSSIINDITLELIARQTFDVSELPATIVSRAALLHDIGVYCCGGFEWVPGQSLSERPYSHHTIAGAQILRQEGFAENIARVAEVHTGVGLTAQDITTYGLQLPVQDYVPATPLEWLITYTAKFHSKAPKFKTAADIEASLAKYGPEKVTQFQQLTQTFGVPDLDQHIQRYREWHDHFQYAVTQSQANPTGVNATQTAVNLNSAGISQPVTVTIEAPPA